MLTKEDKKWIVEAIQAGVDELAQIVAKGFEQCATKEDLRAVEDRLSGRVDTLESNLKSLESRFTHLEQIVVTKEYLDERLGIIKDKDSAVHKQLKTHSVLIVEELRKKGILNPKRANTITSLHPFPQKLA